MARLRQEQSLLLGFHCERPKMCTVTLSPNELHEPLPMCEMREVQSFGPFFVLIWECCPSLEAQFEMYLETAGTMLQH
eukprot:2658960-Amphidinium_carterae.1